MADLAEIVRVGALVLHPKEDYRMSDTDVEVLTNVDVTSRTAVEVYVNHPAGNILVHRSLVSDRIKAGHKFRFGVGCGDLSTPSTKKFGRPQPPPL